jgi:hypothetical protein
MRTSSHFVLALTAGSLALVAIGCIPIDTTIRHPLVAGTTDQNSIVKDHRFAENSRGLPPSSMADAASLTRVSDKDVCFDVTMHELDPIDMSLVRAKMTVKNAILDQAQLWPEQPVSRAYQGLVPERVQVGYESYCATRSYDGYCLAWNTRPVYGTVMRPGTVKVFETRARMCFPNQGVVTASTDAVQLEVVVPRPARSFETTYNGFGWAWGPGDKRTVFGWGFSGAQKK